MPTPTAIQQALTQAVPDTTDAISLPGLSAAVQVYRDRWGIPHIRAANTADAFLAQGFVTAQDRLWQMEYDRRRGSGRWAEVVGASGLTQDLAMRRFRLEPAARADYQSCSAATRALLDAYAQGVNAWIDYATAANCLPAEYAITGIAPEPWQPWDGLTAFKVRHILMGVFESKLWRAQLVQRLGPEKAALLSPGYTLGQLQILPPGTPYAGPSDDALAELTNGAAALNYLRETDSGSNSWVLAGHRTTSGQPLLAGDSHRALDTPNVYYQCHLACPDFDAIGFALPGVPGLPHFGHNARVAWCITHTSADYQDLYIEQFKPDAPDYYLYQSQWRRAEIFNETIQVRGGDPVPLPVYVTQHGPVIAGGPGATPDRVAPDGAAEPPAGLSFRYTATDGGKPWPDIIPAMLRAQDSYELAATMRGWVDPCNNFLFADTAGNIGYLCRGEIPIRSRANGRLPVPGWTGEHEWTGNIPFAELPRAINPPPGYIVTANNKPVGDDYPYYISADFTPGFRAARVTAALLALENPTAADLAKVHAERLSIPAQTYLAYLRDHREQLTTPDALTAAALEKLLNWSGQMDAAAAEPAIYSAMRDALLYRLFNHHLDADLAAQVWQPANRGGGAFLGKVKELLLSHLPAADSPLLPPGETWPALLSAALAQGVAILREKLGDDLEQWQWQRLHQARPQHTLSAAFPELAEYLDPPPLPMAGDGDTPLAGAYAPADLATVGGLSVARYAYDLADWENCLWAIPLGASGHPASPHYADQSETWRQVQMVPMQYAWQGIIANCRAQQTLEPG